MAPCKAQSGFCDMCYMYPKGSKTSELSGIAHSSFSFELSPSLIPSLGYDSGHALVLALGLLGVITAMAIAIGRAARAR